MDITFLVPFKGIAGGLRVVACYGNALIRRGHRVTVVYPKRDLPSRERLRRKLRRIIYREKDHLDAFRGTLREVPAITAASIPDGDAIIATAFQTAQTAAHLPARCGKKYYLIQGYEKVFARNGEEVDATFRLPFKKIVISTWLKTLVEEISGETDIPVIPNGRDFFLSTFDGEGLVRTMDVGLLYSSVPLKRTDVAIEALTLLRKRHPGITIVMFGSDHPDRMKYPNFPFQDVRFQRTPSQEWIRRTYLNTKVWMTASSTEGFCLPALEAISLGCPIVSSDNLGIRDIIADGVEGFIVNVGDPEALADRVSRILSDPQLRIRMSIAALRRADDFSWERSADMLEHALITA
jgi:glycosyltransferase involved in cell wall biosynthesis